jgi:hypothetical protein
MHAAATWLALALLGTLLAGAAAAQTINVEIDYMVDTGIGGHSHQPQQIEIDAAVQMFACQGITLNVVIDDQIPHQTVIVGPEGEDFWNNSDPDGFPALKQQYFDRGAGWHYCIFGHLFSSDGVVSDSSGRADIGGTDLIVTLGDFDGDIGTAWDRSATFAHELGHNLGLLHGGDQPQSQVGPRKPNFASIMSYQYQLTGLRQQMECLGLANDSALFKNLDYSHGRLPTISEAALDEEVGVGIQAVDWDCDGVLDTSPVSQALDELPWCGTIGFIEVLTDFDDWAAVAALPLGRRGCAPAAPPPAHRLRRPGGAGAEGPGRLPERAAAGQHRALPRGRQRLRRVVLLRLRGRPRRHALEHLR